MIRRLEENEFAHYEPSSGSTMLFFLIFGMLWDKRNQEKEVKDLCSQLAN